MKVRDSIQNKGFFYSSHNIVMKVNSVASFRALKSYVVLEKQATFIRYSKTKIWHLTINLYLAFGLMVVTNELHVLSM